MEQSNDDPFHSLNRNRNKQGKIDIPHLFRNLRHRWTPPRTPNNTMENEKGLSEPSVTEPLVQNNMLQNAQNVDIGGNAKLMNIARDNVVTNVTNVVKYDGTHGLEKMEKFVSFSAQFDSAAQDPDRVCHPGTRQNVLEQMKDWADDPNSTERICWLHGPAGAGKSAIAQTLAQSYTRRKVVATFFFYRSDASRNDGNMLFTTLAYQLAFSIPEVKDYIAQALHEHPDLPTKSIERQFHELVVLPFQSLTKTASEQTSTVIIIDGVDESTDEKLQQRFLKIIGDAVEKRLVPFRFLICSRTEAHIEEALNHFKSLILPIDLAKLHDANRDVEKYLVDQFSHIASNRGLDPAWPGQTVIEDIVYKSSGNFIFAAVVIKLASDEDNMPQDQLAIILKLKSPGETSPFAVLDELYLEILRRQRHQDFLKTFLALLAGRAGITGKYLLYEDDTKLMNVSKEELYTKLRRMRSLLKFEPHIDVHHRTFLDFLNEPSRSGDYYICKQSGKRRYLQLVVDSVVRYVSRVIENPDYHETHHLNLEFRMIITEHPLKVWLPIEELLDVLHPLVQIQDKILELANSRVVADLLSCNECAIRQLLRRLVLHRALYSCIDAAHKEAKGLVTKSKCKGAISSSSIQTESMLANDLDNNISALLTLLQDKKVELNTTIINHTYSLLRFDCAEIALKLRSMSDAQRLVDFLVLLIDEKYQYGSDTMSKAAQLVLNIFSRIPVLPRSLLFKVDILDASDTRNVSVKMTHIESVCKAALAWRVLNQDYIHLRLNLQGHLLIIPYDNRVRSEKWRQVSRLDSTIVIKLVLQVAKAIQYLHSMGLSLENFDAGDVHLDLKLEKVGISVQYLDLINPFMPSARQRSLHKSNVFAFGCFFYAVYFNTEINFLKSIEERRRIVAKRRSKPKIPEHAWHLIQRCCAEDPMNRLTIDEVVKEMETWRNQPK